MDYAPGIPSKESFHELPTIREPTVFEFAVHDHHAERRGRHFDLRLGDPSTGHAHSWAMHASWPKPGEKTWAILQPTHSVPYMDFKGEIPEGYGKGKVDLHDRSKTEILESRPGHISFNLYKNSGPEEYTLHRLYDKHWVLFNRTITREKHAKLPDSKPDYKEVSPGHAKLENPNYLASAKIDDAHNLFYFPAAGEKVRVISYRKSKRNPTGIIEHTHKVPGIAEGLKVPEGLGGTILRGGLYALSSETGKAIPARQLATLLNSNVWTSRAKQEELGELIPVLYDVVQFKGRNLEKAPYEEKLKVLQHIEQTFPHVFTLPKMAISAEGKKKLLHEIQSKKVPETEEGLVLWNLKASESPIKVKFSKDHDVYVRGFFGGEGKLKNKGVGGFYFSTSSDGPILGKVGTGFSEEQRKDMFKNPENYLGVIARVKAQEVFPSGALRGSSLLEWHPDKNEQAVLDLIKHGSVDSLEFCFFWDLP